MSGKGNGLLLTEPEPRDPDDDAPEVVEEIGEDAGLTYQENEPLRAGRKEEERDEHRWELDPASSEDYPERCSDSGVEAVPVRHMRHHRKGTE